MGPVGITGTIPKIGKIGEIAPVRKVSAEVDLPEGPHANEETEQEELERYAKQGLVGSLPERIVYKWLEDNHYLFDWQRSFSGGRVIKGGFVVDFIVWNLVEVPVAIRVQGTYWHGPTSPGNPGRDDEDAAVLRAQGYAVCDLWEEAIYRVAPTNGLRRLIMQELNR